MNKDKAREALNCIEQLESDIGYYDMPEHEETLPVSGWALCELLDEVKRWRETHKAGEFNPDYCAASEALSEHLEHCALQSQPPAGDVALSSSLFDTLKAIKDFTDKTPAIKAAHSGYYNAIIGTINEALKWQKN